VIPRESRPGDAVLQPPLSRVGDVVRALVLVALCAGLGCALAVLVSSSATGAGVASADGNSTGGQGSPSIDLSLSMTRLTVGPVHPGDAVEFALVPHDAGPGDAAAGWAVSDRLPAGLTIRSVAAAGYDCSGAPVGPADLTCVASNDLVAGTDGTAITLVVTVDPAATGSLRNESWISPAPGDVPETNPLQIPAPGTDTTTTTTNNDAHADVAVIPVMTHPSVSFDKQVERVVDVNHNGYVDAGDEIFYRFRVTNTGER
jgi:hypothetical protein